PPLFREPQREAGLVPGSSVVVNDDLRGHFVDDRERLVQRGLGFGLFAGGDRAANVLQRRPELGPQRAIVLSPNECLTMGLHRRLVSSGQAVSFSPLNAGRKLQSIANGGSRSSFNVPRSSLVALLEASDPPAFPAIR